MNIEPITLLRDGLSHAVNAVGESARSVELTVACLEQIRACEPRLRSMVFVDYDGARKRAEELDDLIRSGSPPLPLHGVPIVVKEIMSVEKMPDSAGSAVPTPGIFQPEGAFVHELRAAGCVILGKSLSTEFALGQFNLRRPMPVNPCDGEVERVTGGSSCGSAAAQAAGYCGFAVGTDTGGSVRAPAALCGVTGFKPSPGYWSMDGIMPLAPGLDTPGLFTNSVDDLIFIYEALGGEVPHNTQTSNTLRLGVPTEYFFADLDESVAAAISNAMTVLERSGATLVPLHFPDLSAVDDYFSRDLPAELIEFIGEEVIRNHWDLLDPLTRRRLAAVESRESGGINGPNMVGLRRAVDELLRVNKIDAWITPTVPCTAPAQADLQQPSILADWQAYASRNTRCVNALEMAACTISLPTGKEDCLPAGMQIAGPAGSDARVIAISQLIQAALSD